MSKRRPISVIISLIVLLLSSSIVFAQSTSGLEQFSIWVVDGSNNPLPGAQILFQQTSQDFMFSTGWRWEGESTPPDLIERIHEMGFNTGHILAFYEWEGVQPEEDVFHWQGLDHAFNTFGTTRPVEIEFPHYQHLYVSLGPSLGEPAAAPGWVNTEHLDSFQRQYGEYLRQLLTRYRGRVAVYTVFGELEGTAHGLSLEETIDWAKWETALIREIDPDVVILIQVGDTHWYFPNAQEISIKYRTLMPKWRIMELLIDGGVDFDGFAVETHYSMAAPGDWQQLKDAVESLTAYDKYIYIWETFYPSEYNPCVYFNWQDFALTPKETPAVWPYSPGTYTEQWQQDQLVNTLRTLVENDRVLGYNYGTLAGADLLDGPTTAPSVGFSQDLCSQPSTIKLGLLRSDLSPKPGFIAIREYWQSLFTSGKVTTDTNGEAVFSGRAGEYEITVRAEGYEKTRTQVHVRNFDGNTIQLKLQPLTIDDVDAAWQQAAQESNTPVSMSSVIDSAEVHLEKIGDNWVALLIGGIACTIALAVLVLRNKWKAK